MQIEGILAGELGVTGALLPKEETQESINLGTIFPLDSIANVELQLNRSQDKPHFLSDITIGEYPTPRLLHPQAKKRRIDETESSRSTSPNRVTALGQVGNAMAKTRRSSPMVDEVALAVKEMTALQSPSQLTETTTEISEFVTPRELAKLQMHPSSETLGVMQRLVPTEPAKRDLIALYFDHITIWANWTHVPTFLRDLDSQNPILLNAMYAMATRLLKPPPGPEVNQLTMDILSSEGRMDSEVYFARAKRLVAVSLDEPCLSAIVALLSMALYAGGVGRPSSAWMYSGMAVRMAHEMRLQHQPTANMLQILTPVEAEKRKRIWWCCFLLDTCNSAVADRPPFIQPEEATIDLPDDAYWNSLDDEGNALPGVGNTINVHFPSKGFREYVALIVLLSMVLRHVRNRSGEVDSEHAKLENALHEWFNAIPQEVQLVTFTGDVSRSEFVRIYAAAHLNIVYNCTCILLHRPQLTLSNFEWYNQRSFEACTFAAFSINSILVPLIEMDPTVQYMNPFLCFCVFESGMIHLVNAMLGDKLPQSPIVQSQLQIQGLTGNYHEMVQRTAKIAVGVHLDILDRLRHYWVAAEAYLLTLGKLAVEHNVVDEEWEKRINAVAG
jgi:hypothetical protein